MKLARPDVFHPRIVLAAGRYSGLGDGDDDGLTSVLRKRGLFARWLPWDDVDTTRADLVILRGTRDYADCTAEFLVWAGSVPNLLNAPTAVAWNVDRGCLLDLAGRGVASVAGNLFAAGEKIRIPDEEAIVVSSAAERRVFDGRSEALAYARESSEQGRAVFVQGHARDAVTTSLIYLGGKASHALVDDRPVEPDFEIWDAGFAALEAAADAVGVPPGELLQARVEIVGTHADPRLLDIDLVAPPLAWHELDRDTRDLKQRDFALAVESALERLGLGPLSHRRP